jgi:hypothetical protein
METAEVDLETGLEKQQAEFAKCFNMTIEQYRLVVQSCTSEEVVAVFELVRHKNHRSMFRQKMCARLLRWFDLGVRSKPFSEKEFKLLAPTWRINWKLPT